VESPASIFSIAIRPKIFVELNNSYEAIASSPADRTSVSDRLRAAMSLQIDGLPGQGVEAFL
jgi:hypothetical protein